MFNKTLLNEMRRVLLFALCVFVIFGAVYSSIMVVIRTNTDKAQQTIIMNNGKNLVDVEKSIITNKVSRLVSDVLYIADSYQLNKENSEGFFALEKQWLAFSNRKKIYDQIRFIDVDGNELIRVNYSKEGAYLTQSKDLQNKKDRYYFTDTISLKEKQIYISQIDLNIENSIIEQPIKPMIRLSVPCFDQNGNAEGIIILNYLADDMLKQIETVSSTSEEGIFLLNPNGYWIMNTEDSNKEWAFMYPDKTNESFQNQFSAEWREIINNKEGFLITVNGVFNYTNIFLNDITMIENCQYSLVLDEGDYYVVSYASPDSSNGKMFFNDLLDTFFIVLKKNVVVYLFLFLLAVILEIFVVANKNKREKIKYFSEYDVMTGIYNRRAGFEKLAQISKQTAKISKNVCVCFVDINSLKEVNDILGHDMGDELIISVVNGIKKNIRENDFVARLGGDEFLIVFFDATIEDAEKIWERINREYAQINENESRKYVISASHGIEAFNLDSSHIDLAINSADEKMYNEKRMIKKDFKVIRDDF